MGKESFGSEFDPNFKAKPDKVLRSPTRFKNEHTETLAILNLLSEGLTLEGVPDKLKELEDKKTQLEKQKADSKGSSISKLINIFSKLSPEQEAIQRQIQDIDLLIERIERVSKIALKTRGSDRKAA